MSISSYITITKEELEILNTGGSINIQVGKKMNRTLLVGNLYIVKQKQLQEDFAAKLAALDEEYKDK